MTPRINCALYFNRCSNGAFKIRDFIDLVLNSCLSISFFFPSLSLPPPRLIGRFALPAIPSIPRRVATRFLVINLTPSFLIGSPFDASSSFRRTADFNRRDAGNSDRGTPRRAFNDLNFSRVRRIPRVHYENMRPGRIVWSTSHGVRRAADFVPSLRHTRDKTARINRRNVIHRNADDRSRINRTVVRRL